MRACEGCRRRKIKCDVIIGPNFLQYTFYNQADNKQAATTNTWPCSACIRLKLHCVPPTVNYDRDFPPNPQSYEPERIGYDSGGSGDDDYHNQIPIQQHLNGPSKNVPPIYTQQNPYPNSAGIYQSGHYGEPTSSHSQQNMQYSHLQTPVSIMDQHQQYSPQTAFPSAPLAQQSHVESPETYEQDQYGQQNLADLLGELRMDEAGTGKAFLRIFLEASFNRAIAPYLNSKNKTKTMADEPAFEDIDEYKHVLPPLCGPDLKIRIPPELMPDDESILHYFDLYFSNVHQYVPVLNKSLFYQQWQSNRESISPLLLEAIFAISGRLADEPAQGHQWLALASSEFTTAIRATVNIS